MAKAATTTALTSSADNSTSVPFGQPIVFKAAVQVASPGTGIPTGFVTFVDASTPTPTTLGKAFVAWSPKSTGANTGVASFLDASLSVGTHTIVAYYQGSQNYVASDTSLAPDSVAVTASASNTVVWASPNPAVYDAPVTISAVVLPGCFGPVPGGVSSAGPGTTLNNSRLPPIFNGPTGSVQFEDNGSDLGAPVPLVNGQAQLVVPSTDGTIPALPLSTTANPDAITAVYIPDSLSKYGASTSKPYNEVVLAALPTPPVLTPTTTTVTPTSQQITAGSEASFTITVSPATVPGTDTVTLYAVPQGKSGGASPTYELLLGTAAYSSANSDWTFTTTTPLPVGSMRSTPCSAATPTLRRVQGRRA